MTQAFPPSWPQPGHNFVRRPKSVIQLQLGGLSSSTDEHQILLVMIITEKRRIQKLTISSGIAAKSDLKIQRRWDRIPATSN